MRRFYRFLWYAATPYLPFYLRRRLKNHKEEPERLSERYGYARQAYSTTNKAKLLWIHAASVGEVNSILSLIARIRLKFGKDYDILLTTSSRNGQATAQKSAPSYVSVQYLPLDHPLYAKRFMAHYRPSAALWVEQELWPNLLIEAHRQGVRLALINGRLTEKSLHRWHYVPSFAAEIAALFDLVMAQSPQDADNFKALGFTARYIGNLKALTAIKNDKDKHANIGAILPKNRRLWLAASVHSGEESLCYAAHNIVRRDYDDLFLLLVPRYPQEARRMQAAAAQYGLHAVLYSELQKNEAQADCLIIDSFGLLSALYGVVDVAFLGGSSGAAILGGDIGGHNPLEATVKDCIVMAGCDMRNFSYISEKLADADCLLMLKSDSENLARVLKSLLSDEAYRRRVIKSGRAAYAELSRQAEASADIICDWLGER